jgi:hypothetical protein
VAEVGPAKDHTANIFSPLILTGTISTEILISPQEANPKIKLMDDYEFDSPKAATDPAKALWDPAFSADFTSDRGGSNSYAHMLPSGARLPMWSGSCPAQIPILGNRGPEITSVRESADGNVDPILANPNTLTFLIHGNPKKWEGNLAFADNHVEFVTQMRVGTYLDRQMKSHQDILYFDEPDDAAGTNAFLGIFTKAGPTPAAFKSIWD